MAIVWCVCPLMIVPMWVSSICFSTYRPSFPFRGAKQKAFLRCRIPQRLPLLFFTTSHRVITKILVTVLSREPFRGLICRFVTHLLRNGSGAVITLYHSPLAMVMLYRPRPFSFSVGCFYDYNCHHCYCYYYSWTYDLSCVWSLCCVARTTTWRFQRLRRTPLCHS